MNTNKFKSILKKLRENLLNSTAHGVPNIISSEKLIFKLMWSFFLVASTGGCVFFNRNSVLEFFNFDVVSQIKVVDEINSQFPTISFCSDYPFDLMNSIVVCLLKKENCFDKKNHFVPYNDTHFANCYRFNSGNHPNDIIYTNYPGLEYGLRVGLNLNQTPSYKKIKVLTIYIHNHTIRPLTIYNKGIEISTGSKNSFNVERVFTTKLDHPYNQCLKDASSFDLNKTIVSFLTDKGNIYTRKECIEFCFEVYFLRESLCGCNAKLGKVYLECGKDNKSDCYFENRVAFYNNNPDEYCSQFCPFECDSMSLKISPTSFDYPQNGSVNSERDSNLSRSFNSYSEIKKNYIEFIVYYSSLQYTTISESPKTQLSDLISNIGGTLGLFIGISFLSFVEIFEIIIEIGIILFSKKNKIIQTK